jgi:predicted amidohydrolase
VKLRIALAQMRCEKGDWEGNLARAEGYIREAAQEGCDVLVLPEMSLSGYCDPAKFPDALQPLRSPLVARFVEMTARYGIAASGGFIEANPEGKPFITQVLAQNGKVVGVYRKVQVVDEEADWFSPGSDTPVFNLETREGDLTCALAVCADSERPDLFRRFGEGGAKVVFHSSAPGLYGRRVTEEDWRKGYSWYTGEITEQLSQYARDNRLHIAVATQTGATVDEDFPGGSFLFGPDGGVLAQTDGWEETLLLCEVDVPNTGG